ncbi:hypothetical protein GCM10009612_62570 [Streptomyces beijiangensis]
MTSADLHTLAGAFALDALDGDERAAFETHLRSCTGCESEVEEFRTTAGRLALAATITPPPALKQAVLRRIDTVRQEPPSTKPRPGGPRAPWHRMRQWALAACLAAVALGGTAVWQHEQAEHARTEATRVRSNAPTGFWRCSRLRMPGRAVLRCRMVHVPVSWCPPVLMLRYSLAMG